MVSFLIKKMIAPFLHIVLLLFLPASHLTITYSQPLVEVEQGILMGKTVMFSEHEYINIDKELDVYEGVPFAEPPVRFEHPVKKTAWDGPWNATYVRPSCYQESFVVIKHQLEVSEDCLYLNIYAPHGITNAAVMVWIHGGGFYEGSGSSPDFNGEPLGAVGDVILVSVNYRLATFGYLTTGDDILPGNYGMMDQVEALRWVQQNIHAFGGNKDNITIFGESAGSASVNYLVLSKQSRGLFQQGIMESGAVLSSWAFQETSRGREIAFQMGEELGCTTADSNALRQCLRDATAKELYDAGNAAGFVSAPCIDNMFLDDYPINLLKRRDFQRTTMMIGTNADEGTLVVLSIYPEYSIREDPPFVSKEEFEKIVSVIMGNPLLEDALYQQYLDWSIQDQVDLDYFRPLVDLNTDDLFACPSDIAARAHAMAGDSVYLYQMTHKPTVSYIFSTPQVNPSWLGAGHAEEIPFVFGFPFMRVNERMELTGPEKEFSVKFMKLWTEFAKTGTPSMSTDPEDEMYWPRYTVPELEYKVLDLNLTSARALKADYCQFWNDLVPKVRTFTADLSDVEREWRQDFYNWKYTAMEEWWEAFNAYQEATSTSCDAEGCK